MGSAPADQTNGLAGVSVLLITGDIGARERLSRALRAAGAEVAQRRHGPAPAVDVVLVDTATEVKTRKELDLVTADVRMRWSSVVRFDFQQAVPVGGAPELSGVEATILPALAADRALAERLAGGAPVDLPLLPLGPIRILRVAASSGRTLHVRFQAGGSRVDCELADGLLVCAFGETPDSSREGGHALSPLLDMDSADVTITPRERPSAVNIMEPVDQALELAALERQSLLQPPDNDITAHDPRARRPASTSSDDLSATDPNQLADSAPTMAPGAPDPAPEPADLAPVLGSPVNAPRLAVGDANKKFPRTMVGGQLPSAAELTGRDAPETVRAPSQTELERVQEERATVAATPEYRASHDGETPTAPPPPTFEAPQVPASAKALPQSKDAQPRDKNKNKTLFGMGMPPKPPPEAVRKPSSMAQPKVDAGPRASSTAVPKVGAGAGPRVGRPASSRERPKAAPGAAAPSEGGLPKAASSRGLPPVDAAAATGTGLPPVQPGSRSKPERKAPAAGQAKPNAAAFASTQLAVPAPPPPPEADDGLPPAIEDDGLPPVIQDSSTDDAIARAEEERATQAAEPPAPAADPLPPESSREELSVASALNLAIADIDDDDAEGARAAPPAAVPPAPPPEALGKPAPAPPPEPVAREVSRRAPAPAAGGKGLKVATLLAVVAAAGVALWVSQPSGPADDSGASPAPAAVEDPAPEAPSAAAEAPPVPEPAAPEQAVVDEPAAEQEAIEEEAVVDEPAAAEEEAEEPEVESADEPEAEPAAMLHLGDDGKPLRDQAGSDEVCAAAFRAERGGALDEALQLYERGRALDPRNPRAFEGLARIHLARDRAEEAVAAAEQAVSLRRRRDRYRVLLGDALRAAGRPAEARDSYEKALELDPDNEAAAARLR